MVRFLKSGLHAAYFRAAVSAKAGDYRPAGIAHRCGILASGEAIKLLFSSFLGCAFIMVPSPMAAFARWCTMRALGALLLALFFVSGSHDGLGASRLAGAKTVRVYNGAIAYHRASASYGYAVNLTTARAAQVEALKQCADASCEVVVRLRNDCGAVANGPRRFTVGKGATRQEAETKALRACGTGCDIAVWACTR